MSETGALDAAPRARETLRDALRLASWRAPLNSQARMSGLGMAGMFAGFVLAWVAYEYAFSGWDLQSFSPYGLNAMIAAVALEACVILAFAHFDRSGGTARRLVLVYALTTFVALCEYLMLAALPAENKRSLWLQWALFALGPAVYVWLIGAARQAFKGAPGVRRPTLRAFGFIAALVAAVAITPAWPVFAPKNFSRQSANLWEWSQAKWRAADYAAMAAANREAARKAEQSAGRLEAAQGLQLGHALDALAAREDGKANVFTLGVAGWSDQDVFLKEIRQSTDILKSHFKLGDRTLTLINNPATGKDAPIASMQNFGAALRGLARRMDRDKDLLVLVMSSHGSPDGFALSYDNIVDRTLDPETLREMLDASGIKNRVVIVSSCYSGTFVAPLQTPDTMILTAAASDKTSFGCADDRHWTWFGEALFEKALADHTTLAEAFVAAKATIGGWEREQKMIASDPQMFVGEAIARNFPDIVGAPPASLGALDKSARVE